MTFFKAIIDSKVLATIAETNSFSGIDLSEYKFEQLSQEFLTIYDINLSDVPFSTVKISASKIGLSMKFLTDRTEIFDFPTKYFETDGSSVAIEDIVNNGKSYSQYRKKLGSFTLFDRNMRLSLSKSQAYGVIINLSFMS